MNIEILKRKKGIVYRATVGSRGHRVRRIFTRKLDAERWIALGQSEAIQNLPEAEECHPTQPRVNPISLEELFRLFKKGYAEIHQEPGTQFREAKIMTSHLGPYFGARDVNTLSQRDIQQYLYFEARLGERKAATINKHFQVIHKVFAWAVRNGLMVSNPAAGVAKLPTRDTVYSPDFNFLEGEDLLRALQKVRELYPMEFPVLLTAVSTGMRIGEVCALERKDLIDSARNPVFLVRRTFCRASKQFKDTTKGGNSRVVPVSDQLLVMLRPLIERKAPNDLIFFETRGEAIATHTNVYRKWIRAQKLCGIQPRTVHALRHTYATQFLGHGGNSFSLRKILGHSSAKITDKYSHFSQSMVENSRNVVQIALKE